MTGSYERLTREQECERILDLCGPDRYDAVFETLNQQFRLIHNRAQVLLGICGVLLSTSVLLMTGKIVRRDESLDQQVIGYLLIGAGATEIAAAAIVVGGVLRLRWMTELPGGDVRAWVMSSLRYRDSKTLAYHVSIVLLLVSMLLFQIASTLAWTQL